MADDGAVRVAIRVRPFIGIERGQNCESVVNYPSAQQIQLAGTHSFTYDYLYSEASTQAEVYSTCVAPLVHSFFEGYNATILAYGQTGSGKTHTMGTASNSSMNKEQFGIIPRVINELFDLIKSREKTHTYVLNLSFLEIYNDEIFDLLCTIPRGRSDRPIPQIKESRNDKIEVENIVKAEVKSAEETFNTLERGSLSRAVGSTNMNATSSRSHAIFTLQLAQKQIATDELASSDEFITSKFHFVDLAGSERLKRTGAVGERRQEGININMGLLALGNVISALGDPARKGAHVPFRDSKITRLLQDSLGGNSKTLMIANVSPADVNKEETLNTLQYANRARNIKNKPTINRDPMSIKFDALRSRIKELEAELAIYRAGGVPTQEQRAEIAAQAAAVGRPHAFQHSPVGGSGGGFGGGSSPLDMGLGMSGAAFVAPPGQTLVDTRDWADKLFELQRLQPLESEVLRLVERNKSLRGDVDSRNEERLGALARAEQFRLKLEQVADKFPEVRQHLVREKEWVEQEKKDAGTPDAAAAATADASEESAAADTFFTLLAPGGSSNPLNQSMGMLAAQQADLIKLSAKFLAYRAKNQQLHAQLRHAAKQHAKQTRRLKRQLREAAGGEDLYDDEEGGAGSGGFDSHEDDDADADFEVSINGHDSDSVSRVGRASRSRGKYSGSGNGKDSATAAASPSSSTMDSDAMSPSSSALFSPESSPASSIGSAAGGGGLDMVVGPDGIIRAENLSDLEESADESSAFIARDSEEAERLRTLSALKAREHEHTLHELSEQDSEAARLVDAKEEMLAQLEKEREMRNKQKALYQNQVDAIEQARLLLEKRCIELQREQDSVPVSAANPNGGLSDVASAELRTLRDKLKAKERELNATRAKVREMDSLKKQHLADEARIKALSAEIERAKKTRADVAKRKESESNKYREWMEMNEGKLKLLQKDQRKNELALRNLKQEMSQQALQLKRAREANTLLSRKVRDQDSSAQVAAKAAKAAAARGAGSKSARGNAAGSGSASARAAAIARDKKAATHRRKNTKDGGIGLQGLSVPGAVAAAGSHSRSRSQQGLVVDGPPVALAHAVACRAFQEDFRRLLREEQTRTELEYNLRDAMFNEERTQSEYDRASREWEAAGTAGVASAEQFRSLEAEASATAVAVDLAIEHVKYCRAELDHFNATTGAVASGGAGGSNALEERVVAKFKNVLAEPPKHIITQLLKAVLWEHQQKLKQQQSAGGAGGAEAAFEQTHADDAHVHLAGGEVDLGATMVGQRRSLALEVQAITSPSHQRRSTAMIAGSEAAPDRAALSSSPIQRSQAGDSVPSLVSPSKMAAAVSAVRKSQSHAFTGVALGEALQQAHAQLNTRHGWSPLQPHLVMPFSISNVGVDLSDDDELEHLSVSNEAREQAAAMSAAAPQPLSYGAPTLVMHNNFTLGGGAGDASPIESPLSHSLDADKLSGSGSGATKAGGEVRLKRAASASSTNDTVFSRLTDPHNFTGVSKNKFDTGVTSANRELAALSNSRGRSAAGFPMAASAATTTLMGSLLPLGKKSVITGSGLLLGAALHNPPSQPLSSASLGVRSHHQLDRAHSPGGGAAAAAATAGEEGASGTAAAPALKSLPIHERLADPRYFTGAQKQKFAEGPKTARAGPAAAAAAAAAACPLREREEGFVLGHGHKNSISGLLPSQRASLERERSESAAAEADSADAAASLSAAALLGKPPTRREGSAAQRAAASLSAASAAAASTHATLSAASSRRVSASVAGSPPASAGSATGDEYASAVSSPTENKENLSAQRVSDVDRDAPDSESKPVASGQAPRRNLGRDEDDDDEEQAPMDEDALARTQTNKAILQAARAIFSGESD